MKPRFAVLNELERNDFEKEWHLSYGYAAAFVTTDIEQAMEWLETEVPESEFGWVIEEVTSKGRSVVYRR